MKTSSKKYTHLQLSERINIESSLNKKCSLKEIARNINKSVNTVKRKIDNRKIPTSGNYFNGLSKACVIIKKSPFVCNGCQNVKKCRCDFFLLCQ
jgi:IS30 family transposase